MSFEIRQFRSGPVSLWAPKGHGAAKIAFEDRDKETSSNDITLVQVQSLILNLQEIARLLKAEAKP